jgi:hypothetical protein
MEMLSLKLNFSPQNILFEELAHGLDVVAPCFYSDLPLLQLLLLFVAVKHLYNFTLAVDIYSLVPYLGSCFRILYELPNMSKF